MKRISTLADSDALRRVLVESFEEDAAPRGAKLAAMAAFGITLAPSALSTAGASAVAHGPASSGAIAGLSGWTAAPKIGAIVALKWFGVGLLGGAAIVGPAQLLLKMSGEGQNEARPRVAVGEPEPAQRRSAAPGAPRSNWRCLSLPTR